MMRISYLSLEEALQIYQSTIINSGGGDMGELDVGKLDSVLNHIQNDDYYPTFLDKMVHLFFCACKFHSFVDGNKRIAITLTAMSNIDVYVTGSNSKFLSRVLFCL